MDPYKFNLSKAGTRVWCNGGVAITTGHVLPNGLFILENYIQDGFNLRKEMIAVHPSLLTEVFPEEK